MIKPGTLLILGAGYSGRAVATQATAAGWDVIQTRRDPDPAHPAVIRFDAAAPAIHAATHLLVSVPPTSAGDPALLAYASAIAQAPRLRWIGYLSTTGVYGDRQGGWVDEHATPAPSSDRGQRRLAAEQGWATFANHRAVDLMRLAGIYGPGRSVLDDVRAGTARRIEAPTHRFGRIHVEDIAGMVLAAMQRATPGLRVLHGNDNEPAASADVIAHAAMLLGLQVPPLQPLAAAWPTMSPIARSFWAENRRVSSRLTQAALGRSWTYPSYREGLAAILAAEHALTTGQHPQ